jgi:hypothetical protein
VIYFVQNTETKLVKIGYSTRHSIRLAEIEKEEGSPLKGLGALSGERDKEKELHRRFEHLRPHGEWFHHEEDLETFIFEETNSFTLPNDAYETLSVKLHTDVIEAARIVGADRNESMTDMLSDILRPILARMEQEEVSRRTRPAKVKGGPK